MVKKFSKYGNSLAVIIDKPILKLLNIDENTSIKIRTDGTKIIIEPIFEKSGKISSDSKVQKAFEEVIKKHSKAFKKLAKN